MDFQTNVLRDGEWVTETINVQSLLRPSAPPADAPRQRVAEPPTYGLLTKTVVESPVAHWILPVRLRSAQHMDVAFVGDHYVQISELGRDGRLLEVIRKTDFGARIRNAKVIGSFPESEDEDEEYADVKMEDRFPENGQSGHATKEGVQPQPSACTAAKHRLPPQQLLVVLETGDCIFLFLRPGADTHPEFVATQYQPHGNRLVQPGFHAAVDPNSRYMALACAEGLFVVYELESYQNLNRAHNRGEPLHPIKTFAPRPIQGIIHKMEFLYPDPNDDYHVIILVIVVRKGDARMLIYDWEAGDDLSVVFAEERQGHELPPQHQLPLLIVPLTLHSAFFAISEQHIGVCANAVHRPSEYYDFRMAVQETSRFHHGNGVPLWSAWTRPYRLPTYNTKRDSIYLAREDGVVMFLDIDPDNILGASVEIGKFDCNIGTSFCSLFDDFNDILIMGGDSGPGTIWQIRPRQPNTQLGTIPNWSPVLDAATADQVVTFNQPLGRNGNPTASSKGRPPRTFTNPDRVFATSGRGVTGAVTEFRRGLRASTGLDIDIQTALKNAWIFQVSPDDSDVGYHVLISLVDTSAALCLTTELAQDDTIDGTALYDLDSRTVAAAQLSEDAIIQVTENSLVFSGCGSRQRVLHHHSDTFRNDRVAAEAASICGDLAAVSTHVESSFCIHLLQLTASRTVTVLDSAEQTGDVTCLSLAAAGGLPSIVAGIYHDGKPSIVVLRISETMQLDTAAIHIDLSFGNIPRLRFSSPPATGGSAADSFEALSSIALLPQHGKVAAAIVFGTRGGEVATLLVDDVGKPIAASTERVGLSVAHLTVVDDPTLGMSILTTCDGRVTMQSGLDATKATFRSMNMVWVVDAADPIKPMPFINSTTVLRGGLPGRQGKTQLLFSSRSRLNLAELHSQPGPVPRTLPLKGTPVRMLYSQFLNCLVVAIRDLQNRTALQFLDPDTGDDLSRPTDKHGDPVDFVSGLGKAGDHVLSLGEWDLVRDGDRWVFLLVGTRSGRFLIVSLESPGAHPGGKRKAIKHWTRYKKPRYGEPVYSVVASADSVFYCAGSTVYWNKLDLQTKRLVHHADVELGSHATTLRIVNRNLVAVTNRDSLEVFNIEGGNGNEMTLHHADAEFSSAAHVIEIGGEASPDGNADPPMLLLSDRNAGVAGIWVPWGQPGRDCPVVFGADLPASVRRFVRGRTRPGWQQARRDVRYGLVPSSRDGADILGVCLDGSVQSFTVLSFPIWQVLRLAQNLAMSSPTLYPFIYEELDEDVDLVLEVDSDRGMQIDGDMLQRCLDKRCLEELFAKPAHAKLLFALLDKLDDGRWTAAFRGRMQGEVEGDQAASMVWQDEYFGLMYDVLEYYVEPVL